MHFYATINKGSMIHNLWRKKHLRTSSLHGVPFVFRVDQYESDELKTEVPALVAHPDVTVHGSTISTAKAPTTEESLAVAESSSETDDTISEKPDDATGEASSKMEQVEKPKRRGRPKTK